jgi:hypothetical protein
MAPRGAREPISSASCMSRSGQWCMSARYGELAPLVASLIPELEQAAQAARATASAEQDHYVPSGTSPGRNGPSGAVRLT